MLMTQIYELVNDVTSEVLGEVAVLNEDLSNLTDFGTALFDTNKVDHWVKKLVDHIGKVQFVNRAYNGIAPSIYMDGWEYGAVMQKISMVELPEATENESWNLVNGTSYDPNIFTTPNVENKFYNKKVTFEIPMSFVEEQVKSAFSSAEQMNSFISMIYTAIENSMTIKTSSLAQRTINTMIAYTSVDDNPMRFVNLYTMFKNAGYDTEGLDSLDKCLANPDFIRYSTYIINMFSDRLSVMSTLFNAGERPRFTPKDKQHLILLSNFDSASKVFLQSDTYNKELVALMKHETVPYWQGSGNNYATANTSAINVKHTGVNNNDVSINGIVGVLFDHDALGVTCINRRVTTQYNGRAEFMNYWYKYDAGYFADTNENFVTFVINIE